MFHLVQPTLEDLTQTDVDLLKQFADREIAAGRYVQGARLRTLLTVYEKQNARDYEHLLSENETMARELHKALLASQKAIEALDTDVASAVDTLDELLSLADKKRPPPPGTRLAVALEGVRAFHAALEHMHDALRHVAADVKQHVEDADSIATPIDEKKKE